MNRVLQPVILLPITLALLFDLQAEPVEIRLSWPSGETELEGLLVIPNPATGIGEPVNGTLPEVSSDRLVSSSGDLSPSPDVSRQIFRINRFVPGTYRFWIKSKFIEEGFDDPDFFTSDGEEIFHHPGVTIEIRRGQNLLKTIQPGPHPGFQSLVWLAFEIDGLTGMIYEANQFFPNLRFISGLVIDSQTGDILPGAYIILKNRDTRETVARIVGGADGRFHQPVDPGRYLIFIGSSGYISDSYMIDMLDDLPVKVQAVLSKIMPSRDYRIVLTWGRYPLDLDAHLRGPEPGKPDFHIYWNRRAPVRGFQFLDRDDRESFGPETITIRDIQPGLYTFSVHNYSDRQATSGDALSRGNAEVKVYNGDKLLKTYRLPTGIEGNYWRVFNLDGRTGQLTDLNQTGFIVDPEKL